MYGNQLPTGKFGYAFGSTILLTRSTEYGSASAGAYIELVL